MEKFVFFGRSNFQYNGFDSMKVLLNDVIDDKDFFYIDTSRNIEFSWLNFFYLNRIGTFISKRIGVPFQNMAFQSYLKFGKELEKDDQIYFVFIRHELWFFGNEGFLAYLKKRYPKAKFVYLLLNVNRYLGIDFKSFCPYFDMVITIDEGDAQKYGLEFHPFFYSAIDKEDASLPESDCFYIGNAKERLDDILQVYKLLTENGLKCDFHIVGVPEGKQCYKDKISYNKPMNYDDVVCHVKKTKVLLEVMQEGQTSGTLREHEAVIYGKKLITNNRYISTRSFYSKNNIFVFNKACDIDMEFVKKVKEIVYEGKADISPRTLLYFIRESLGNEV